MSISQSVPPGAMETLNPFTEEEEMYRRSVRRFLDRELEPHFDKFVGNPEHDRLFWRKAGQAGLLGSSIGEAYGGPGASELCLTVLSQEFGRSIGGATVGSSLGADVASHILMAAGTGEQKRSWSAGILDGSVTQCLALTEPDAGSDLKAVRTTAVKDGGYYVVNGSKTYISNGNKAELLYVVVKTEEAGGGHALSVLIIDGRNTSGITRRRMQTAGYPAYDLAEIFFDNVRVPRSALLGEEGEGLHILLGTFALDRFNAAARALGEAELAYRLTLDWVPQRKAFGQFVIDFQNTQFTLADMKTDLAVGTAFLHDGVRRYRAGRFDLTQGAMQKLWITEMSSRVLDGAVQLFGGAGFMEEMPIARLYKANRVHRLYAGTSELQKVAIARAL
jgi:acyl-CoA dehydrogenase